MSFNPNEVTFAQGAVRVEGTLRKLGVDVHARIMTSRDDTAQRLRKALPVTNVPPGFSKYQWPFVLSDSQLFMSQAPANAKVAEHSHDEGDGIRFIVQGSVTYNGTELTAGDWIFIPKGSKYSLAIGAAGATMAYCYCCSCAGIQDVRQFIIDPAPDRG